MCSRSLTPKKSSMRCARYTKAGSWCRPPWPPGSCPSSANPATSQTRGDRPKALPCQALDHASGYLMAFGAMMALHRRAAQGGSWLVRVSLAQTGHWIRALGAVPDGLGADEIDAAAAADRLETTPSGFGPLTAVRHAACLSETPAKWVHRAVPLGSHPPAWGPAP